MKNTTIKFLTLLGLLTLAACNKEQSADSVSKAEGKLVLEVSLPDSPQTKAPSAYSTAQTYESQVNSVQILVFNSSTGALDRYYNAGKTLTGISLSTVQGTKDVWAVINGPDLSGISSLSALQATALSLGGNQSTTASTGFVMAGSASCTVGTSTASCNISANRFVSRVALVSVKNAIPSVYGSLTVNAVWLSNVVGNQNLAGNASANTWYNKFGRADESPQVSSHIIDGSTYKASCPDLTFKSLSQSISNGSTHTPSTPYLLYTFPNSSTTAPKAFSTSFSAQRTVLVVKATVNGTAYYYPVPLDDAAPSRNTTYTVALTITGIGSTDPNVPVQKGNMTVNVTVSGWTSGQVYDETI